MRIKFGKFSWYKKIALEMWTKMWSALNGTKIGYGKGKKLEIEMLEFWSLLVVRASTKSNFENAYYK